MHHLWLSVFSILSAALLVDLAIPHAPLWGDIRIKHTWNTVPVNWESLGPPPAGTTIDLHIALTPHRGDALIDALYEVSDPRHKKNVVLATSPLLYGAHLTKEQVAELVAPHQDTLEIVHSWLEHHGVPPSSISTSHGGGWLTITGVPVSQADELLCASYQLYRHTGTDETEVILQTVGYSLPAALHAHVQTVAPTTHFAPPRKRLQTPRKDSSDEAAVTVNMTLDDIVRTLSKRDFIATPPFLRWLYKTEAYVPSADRNVLGIMGSNTGAPSRTDLTRFMTEFREDAADATFTFVNINGGVYNPNHPGDIESVHTQYAAAMAYPTPQHFYSMGGKFLWSQNGRPHTGDLYLAWFSYVLNQQTIPPTISISDANPERLFPAEYAKALCGLFSQLASRGATVLVTSGDYGVGNGDCRDWRGSVRFMPMFPASCPWVTSVGGTKGHNPEVAAGFSGGGFSNYFRRPGYQTFAVPSFLKRLGTDYEYAGLYQPWGRGIPDIAARADNFAYVRKNFFSTISGTTCSTATVTGIVSLLNDYVLSKGGTPLGFLNPLLYGITLAGAAGVNDITRGSNPGCNTRGFPATIGWDPVTGVGTPDFEGLLRIYALLFAPSGTTAASVLPPTNTP